MENKKINILVLDGGGARGTALIEQLVQFEDRLLGGNLIDHFDMFSGTSTGGIIAAMLSVGFKPKRIRELYVQFGADIFDPSFWRRGIFRSKYSDKNFNRVLAQFLGDKTLSDCTKALIVPAYNVSTMDKVIFKSANHQTQNFKLFDIVRATASAPTFFDPWIINSQVYIDGGVVINNPSLVCYTEALKLGYSEINILSFGTGRTETPISKKKLEKGILRNASALFDICLSEQTQTTDYFTTQFYEFIKHGSYLRAECVIEKGSGKIDDFSEANTRAMLEDGRTSYRLNESALKLFVEKTK
jgi:patatin-like phospholipase/acyl hydrolase